MTRAMASGARGSSVTLLEATTAVPDPLGAAIAGLLLVLGALGKWATRRPSDKPALVRVDAAALYEDLREVLRARGPSLIGGPVKGDWQEALRHGAEVVVSLRAFAALVEMVTTLYKREAARIHDEEIEAAAVKREEERAARRRERTSDDFGEASESSQPGRRRKEP